MRRPQSPVRGIDKARGYLFRVTLDRARHAGTTDQPRMSPERMPRGPRGYLRTHRWDSHTQHGLASEEVLGARSGVNFSGLEAKDLQMDLHDLARPHEYTMSPNGVRPAMSPYAPIRPA